MEEKNPIEDSLVGAGEPSLSNDLKNNVPELNKLQTSASQTWRFDSCNKCEDLMEILHSKDYEQFLEYRSENGYFITKKNLTLIYSKLEDLRQIAHESFTPDQAATAQIVQLKLANIKLQSLFEDVARKNQCAMHCIKTLKSIIMKLEKEVKKIKPNEAIGSLTNIEQQWMEKIIEEEQQSDPK